jgi:hypothetical protein
MHPMSMLHWNETEDGFALHFQRNCVIARPSTPILDPFDDFEKKLSILDDSSSATDVDYIINMPDDEFSLVVAELFND